MAAQLALAPKSPASDTDIRTVSASQAAQLYARYKESQSWCVDMSGNFPILLHALSNRTATPQDLKLDFPQWAQLSKLRVEGTEFVKFLTSLPDRVMSILPRVYGMGMRPCAQRFIIDDDGIALANTYNPVKHGTVLPLPVPYAEAVELFGQNVPIILEEMLVRVFPIADERKFMVQRLAAIIQTPMKRAKHGVFLCGQGGSGKSSILDILETALGRRHIDRSSSYAGANDKHSEVYCNNIVVAHEDKAIGSNAELYTYTNLKQVIDYGRRNVNIKHGQRAVMREVYSNIFITTNKPDLFPWDSNERRFYAPQEARHKVDEEESKTFFTKFHDFLALTETPAVLHKWLMEVDLAGFNYGSCPRTPYMESLINDAGSMLDKHLEEFLEERDIFHPLLLDDYLKTKKQFCKSDELKSALTALGFEYQRMMFKCEGIKDARFRVWRKKGPPGRHFRPLTDAESREMMTLEGCTF